MDGTTATLGRVTDTARQLAAEVPLCIHSPHGCEAGVQPLRTGVPLPRGTLRGTIHAALRGNEGIAVQTTCLARWPDDSVKWLLVEFLAPRLEAGASSWWLELHGDDADAAPSPGAEEATGEMLADAQPSSLFQWKEVSSAKGRSVGRDGRPVLTNRFGRTVLGVIESSWVEAAGPVRRTRCHEGRFPRSGGLRFRLRISSFAATGLIEYRLTLHNPRRARHRGGLWDLGDRGSCFFQALDVAVQLPGQVKRVEWRAESAATGATNVWATNEGSKSDGFEFSLYQDSSGGRNWNSRNHVNRHGRVPCRLQGYEMDVAGTRQTGYRAAPSLSCASADDSVTIAVPEFWQQFPKSLSYRNGTITAGLFPRQWDDLFELQGGEQKTHTIWFRLATADQATRSELDALAWVHQPARVSVTPEWCVSSGAVRCLPLAQVAGTTRLDEYLSATLQGPESFFDKREVIDEYGWRNYGDVWADHEAQHFQGSQPVISHYNNQFDLIYGMILQWLRSGDSRWFALCDSLARHVMDIDLYHTTRDRAAYSGGPFWFTDHYLDAATSTHRTYSRANRPRQGSYGGGPGSEHCFGSGLRHYYYLTGNEDAAAAVLQLANWVIRMDDGRQNILGLVDPGPTGLASRCGDIGDGVPGRGAANSIEVLLDAYELSEHAEYLEKAEELIRRCIHPRDDLTDNRLLNAERHWSYTMFLAAVSRYLELKAEYGWLDQMYAYGRSSLLHYADWMLEHERPYLDHPEQLEYPTEAWPAQELRKANVLRFAARHARQDQRDRLLDKARVLAERAWQDLLRFDTCRSARAVALIMVEGTREVWSRSMHELAELPPAAQTVEDTPPAEPFLPQRTRVLQKLPLVGKLLTTR